MSESKSNISSLTTIESVLAYHFKDPQLLMRALTHRSWAHEQVAAGNITDVRQMHNEALEFVGDSVLGLIVAAHLFRDFPEGTEGELSRMKHQVVSTATLAGAAKRMGIGGYLRFGRGEEKTGGRKKSALLADAFEAILGAIYFDGGMESAELFVERALEVELNAADPASAAAADYKTMLQERLQGARVPGPRYEVVETEGPPHRRRFHVEVSWTGGAVRAEGSTIKSAEISAARSALELLDGPLLNGETLASDKFAD